MPTIATEAASYQPRLAKMPDARLSRWPVFDPAFLPYAALLLGAAPAGLAAIWNAVGMRRHALAVTAGVVAVLSWLTFGALVVALWVNGVRNIALIEIVGRLANLLFGLLLAHYQWPHVRGHVFLGGRAVPLMPAVLVVIALAVVLPRWLLYVSWGFWQILLVRG